MSSVYGRYPKDFTHQKGEYKAEDYLNFLHHYSLPLFYQNLDPTVFKAWKHFAYSATLSTKIEIDEHNISGAETAFVTFLTWYYKTVYQRKRKRLAAYMYTMHALCHISICMKWWGPFSNV